MERYGFGREEWLEKLMLIDRSLNEQGASAQLTLVGSAAGIPAGQPSRTSMDLDVWKPTSVYRIDTLRNAVESAGLLFDPKSVLEPQRPHIQLMEPGLAQTGSFDRGEPLEQFAALRLERPPIANLIAAKLIRAEEKDLEDIAFLLASYQPPRSEIRRAIKTMPLRARGRASENLIYLQALGRSQPNS
jgi:hypothetical protein